MRSLLVLIALIASPFGAIAQTPESAAHDQPTVAGTAMHLLPDTNNGEVEVIAVGVIDQFGRIPVIVRNNTDREVVDAIAKVDVRDAAGKLIGVGDSGGFSGLAPSHLRPGDIAIGYITLTGLFPGRDDVLTYSATATDKDEALIDILVDVEFGELNWITDKIVGEVKNPTDEPMVSVSMKIVCFNADGTLNLAADAYILGEIPALSAATFQADGAIEDLTQCERFLIAGSGVNKP